MADSITRLADVDYDQTAYDRMAYFALRDELYFDAVADVMPTRQSMPGSAVVFRPSANSTAIFGRVRVPLLIPTQIGRWVWTGLGWHAAFCMV